jgi:hypothetical protein
MQKHNAMLTPLIVCLIVWLKPMLKLGLLLMMGVSMSAGAGLFGFGGTSWKEEVLLHDGSKLIVERSQTRGGRHEIGQEVPINSHKISFTLPGTRKAITWEVTIGLDASDASLGLLALDVVKGVPYIVTSTFGCHAYNKWGRPNPPYVFFKYDGKAWQRIPLAEFPTEIKEANVVEGTQEHERRLDTHTGVVTADEIKKINGKYSPSAIYLQVFVREEIKSSNYAPVLGCSKFE